MPNWTPQQKLAIDARNRTILVSAAAGSGKTAVLIERIVQLIREGAQMNRMLIVTFTKAAAGEMRQRLNKKLTQEAIANPDVFAKALDDLETTEISTIHSFCQKVLKNHFQVIGIDPMMTVCDDQKRKMLFQEAWLDALNQLLEEGDDPSLMELAQAYDQKKLLEMTAQLYDFLMSLPDPHDWLERAIDGILHKPYERHPWFVTLQRHTKMMLGGTSQLLQTERAMLNEEDAILARMETWQQDCDACAALEYLNWHDIGSVRNALAEFSLPKLKNVRGMTDAQKDWQKGFTKIRDSIKKIVKDALDALTIDEERLDLEFGAIQFHLRGLAALVRRTDMLFHEKKAQKHLIDFADMEQFTMQIMKDAHALKQIQGEYDHIFVDECQDVSQVQDAILMSIHSESNCMFMVGDVKQSIYRFRKADPTLFLHRIRTFEDDPESKTLRIILQKNFRSRANVLEATNQVFRTTMRPAVTELTYEPVDELICGRTTTEDPPVEMHLLDISPGEDGEKPEALAAEAKIVADRIRELLNEAFEDGDETRNYTYRDMVILLSAASNTAPKLVELLSSQEIPVFYDGAAAYYALPEVQSVKALLMVLDNPLQDVPLLAALKMPPFAFTDEQLGTIRLAKTGRNVTFAEAFDAYCGYEDDLGEKCRAFIEQMQQWRFIRESRRLSDFVWHVIRDSGFYAACGAQPKGELKQANLRMLYQRAVDFEANGGETLSEFIRMMDQQAASDDRMTAKILGEGENLVRIMTMHKSKGLEFPVVFCMQMSGKLHKANRGEVLMHTELGLAMPYVNRQMNIRRKTMADDAFKVKRELDEKAERARLLYVAMTRAKERLIMVGCCSEKDRAIWTLPDSDFRVWKASSMTDWIMQGDYAQHIHKLSTGYAQGETPWNFRLVEHPEVLSVDKVVDNHSIEGWLYEQLGQDMQGYVRAWDRMDDPDMTGPAKTSVSAIAKKEAYDHALPLQDSDEDAETKRQPEEIVAPLRLSDIPARPAFMEERRITGAERGTLMHRFLSLVSLEKLRESGVSTALMRQEAHDMVDRGVFTAQELLLIDTDAAAEFFCSELGKRMLRADQVRREWSFNLRMQGMNDTLLQGVIDCAFHEQVGWVIVDYKTDHIVDEDAFRQRYAMQIEWYARALERISGQEVRELWLYAIGKKKAYRMERIPE
ncbi:MAG: helicase-exonuclease AddAB subunit AddA [Clostridia bacterium]|nr:helicase-exonuclease AddAB subunit AddA [Clostridia bacterium]